MISETAGLFGQLKTKMTKIADCYVSIAESFDYSSRFKENSELDTPMQNSNRLSSVYKYMSTMFNEWALNCKLNSEHFYLILAGSNKKSLTMLSTLYDVGFCNLVAQTAI